MIIVTFPPKSTEYNQGEGLMGHTTKGGNKIKRECTIGRGDEMGDILTEKDKGKRARGWSLIGN